MNKFKKVCAIIIGLLLLGILTGCGEQNESTSRVDNTTINTEPEDQDDTIYEHEVIIVNNTGIDFDNLYISPFGENKWGESLLKECKMPSGTKDRIKFISSEKVQSWDIKINNNDGTEMVWRNLDLLVIHEITLEFDGQKLYSTIK